MTATPSPLAPPMNHVLVDFENVHQVDLSLIGAKGVSFTLMVGPQQGKLDSGLVERLMEHSASVRLVKLKKKGNNAVDFAVVYYLGQVVASDPTAYFHVISKDAGYDPLIEHLRERHVNVRRYPACEDLTFSWLGKKEATAPLTVAAAAVSKAAVKEGTPPNVGAKKVAAKKAAKKAVAKKVTAKKAAVKVDTEESRIEAVLKDLRADQKSRPKKRKTLVSKIAHLIKKTPEAPEVPRLIDRLLREGVLIFDEKDVVTYKL